MKYENNYCDKIILYKELRCHSLIFLNIIIVLSCCLSTNWKNGVSDFLNSALEKLTRYAFVKKNNFINILNVFVVLGREKM